MGKNRGLFWGIFFLCISFCHAQEAFYFVVFKNKKSKEAPKAFLSEKTQHRRSSMSIGYDSTDLPVCQEYTWAIAAENGITVLYPSRWLNGVVVQCSPEEIGSMQEKSFVASIRYLGSVEQHKTTGKTSIMQMQKVESLDYGNAAYQIQSLGADKMHDLQLNGKGVFIAVFDGGFQNANQLASLSQLYEQNRVKFTYNVVNSNSDVYVRHTHGTNVLSCIGGYSPGKLIGIAYGADFALFITEDVSGEKLIEEYHWLRAAELADSLGVDIISSSLGYNTFDDSSQDHKLSELDGKTTVITQAAQMAARKGILVVNSAGNNYTDASWRNIVFPCDADSVLAVGSVDTKGVKASFSAVGPTADNRIKPNVCAIGTGVIANSVGTNFSTVSGTSYSAPLVAGLAAGLWQADSTLSNIQLLRYIEQSASSYCQPNNQIGHGIPNFSTAYQLIKEGKERDCLLNGLGHILYPNPVNDLLTLQYTSEGSEMKYQLFDIGGKELISGTIGISSYYKIKLDLTQMISGIYFLRIGDKIHKIVKM